MVPIRRKEKILKYKILSDITIDCLTQRDGKYLVRGVKDLHLTVSEYEMFNQALLNKKHIINEGVLYLDEKEYDTLIEADMYIRLNEHLQMPLQWYKIEISKNDQELWDFSKTGNHFFIELSSIKHLNELVNVAETKGYVIVNFNWQNLRLEMKKEKDKNENTKRGI